jgi:sugar phosphate permease
VLGIWLGGVLGERYGWRAAFVALGVPGLALALLASRLREPRRRPPPPIRAAVAGWYARGRDRVRQAWALGAPLVWLTLAGAALASALQELSGLPEGIGAAVFAVCVSIGIIWTVVRLVPVALRGTTEAGEVAASAYGDFLQAARTVLRTPTLIWMFVGGALVTFAVNGLIAWAPSFMQRTHGLSVATVGREFGLWGLAGGALGALFGGRTGDWLLARWSGGRVVVSGAGFVLGGPVCAALLLIDELRLFVPLLFATFFLYSWYNGPLSAVILDVVPPAVRASVLGAFVLYSHLAGDAIAPPLIGYLSDRFGLRPAMLLLPTAGAVGGLVILIALTTVARDMHRVQEAR